MKRTFRITGVLIMVILAGAGVVFFCETHTTFPAELDLQSLIRTNQDFAACRLMQIRTATLNYKDIPLKARVANWVSQYMRGSMSSETHFPDRTVAYQMACEGEVVFIYEHIKDDHVLAVTVCGNNRLAYEWLRLLRQRGIQTERNQ